MFDEKLFEDELEARGLPRNIAQIVGRPFLFGDGAGEDTHVIAGTVVSIGYGGKEGLALYVSSPRFKGVTIRRLKCVGNVWCVESSDEKATRPVGTFKLL